MFILKVKLEFAAILPFGEEYFYIKFNIHPFISYLTQHFPLIILK